MKIGYQLINSPFKYHCCYLNVNLDDKAPPYKPITLFGTLVGGASRTPHDNPHDIKLSIPINNSGKGGFNYTFKVATVFDNIVTNNKTSKPKSCKMLTSKIIGPVQQKKPKISKMMMERTSPTLSTKFAPPFSIMLPPLDALLPLVTAFSITCVVARKNQ